MKKIFYSIIVAGLALVSAACQKLDEQKIAPDSSNNLTVTASIVNFDGTKVSYAFSDLTNAKSGIKPSWVVDDAIFGFDDKGGTFSFSVESIDDNGKATFSTTGYSPAEGVTKLYAVYYPGEGHNFVGEGANKTLSVDLSSQSGTLDGDAPAIMCATGTIKDNIVNFAFTNQTAVVGIYKMQVYKDGAALATSPITGVSLGNVLTQGTVKLEGGEFKLYPSADHGTISAENLNLKTDGEGCVEVSSPSNTYFAVIPEQDASITVNASDGTNTYKTNASITGNINAGSYYYLGKKIYGGEVATVGGTSYATISEAFAAAEGGQTIQLQNNCEFDSQITLAGKSGEITLDLNGCTLKNGPTLNNKQSRFYLNNEDVTLIIQDLAGNGKITSDKVDQDIIRIIKGNLKVVSGTIEAPAATDGGNAAIWVAPASEGTTTNASVTVTGGKILGPATVSTDDKRAYALYVDNPGADVSVSGGEFSAQSNSMRIMDAKSVNITGGTFTCEASEYTLRFASSKAAGEGYNCNISGDETTVTCTDSYALYAVGDGLNLNISGGQFTGKELGISVAGGNVAISGNAKITCTNKNAISVSAGELTITGGYFKAGGTYAPVWKSATAAEGTSIEITGGCYSKAPVEEYLKRDYESANNTDQATKETYPYMVKEYKEVATLTVGSGQPQGFSSVEAAVAEANKEENKETACTITLTAPSTVGAQAVISNTAGVTLNLNDQTLTFGGTDRIYVAENAKLTIVDNGTNHNGTILQSAKGSNTISLTNAGSSLTISGGKITCADGQTAATVYVTNGTLNMDGGEITGIKVGISMGSDKETPTSPTVKVSGNAKVTSTGSNAIAAGAGKLTIEGGYFKANAAVIYTTSTSITDYVASGGYYNKALKEEYITVKEGYVCVSEPDASRPDYDYVVKEFSTVATLTVGSTSTDFASVEDAVTEANKATQACTITLTASSTVGAAATVTNSYGVTLNLNGKTLTHDGSKRIGLSGSGKLTIVDNGTGGTIIQTTAGSSTLTFSSGTLTIEGGTITKDEGATFNTINVSGGNLYVTGGTITNNASGYATIAVTSDSEKGTSGTAEISGGDVTSSGQYAISVNGTGDLTVKGTAKVKSTASRAIDVSGSGKLSVSDSAELKSTAGSAVRVADDGKLTMTGGSIIAETSTTSSVGITIPAATEGKEVIVNISGGYVTSSISNGISAASGKLTITGGHFAGRVTSSRAGAIYKSGTSTAEIEISGGYFSTDPKSYVTDFHRSVANSDETYTYKVEEYVPVTLAIGSGDPQPYATIELAVTAANTNSSSPCTITINDDLKTTAISNVTNGNGVTLDLNNHTLTYAGTNRIRPATGGKLIIKDSGTNGKITNTTATNVMYYTGGELVLQGGTIMPFGTCTGVVYVENAKFTMEGGTITDNNLNVRALTIGGSNTATVNITGGTILGGNVGTVKVDDVYYQTGAIFVNNSNATCTINGADVVVEAPNVQTGDYAVRPIVSVVKGAFKLVKGTIGSTDVTTSDNGNMTAVQVYNGTFDMEGGYIYARHHAIIFNGSGAVTISGGRLATTKEGWSLLRFQANVTNTLTISGGGFTAVGTSGKIFAGSTTGASVPSTAIVSITPTCYFDKTPKINGISDSNITGKLSQGTYTYDGKSYGFKVE